MSDELVVSIFEFLITPAVLWMKLMAFICGMGMEVHKGDSDEY